MSTALKPQQVEPSADDECQWIEDACRGDVGAFRLLYDHHVGPVTRHVGRLLGYGPETEDVVQEIFVQVFRCLHTYRGESAFSTWLYRLSRNVAISHLRRRTNTVDLDAWRALRMPAESWGALQARDLLRILHAALEQTSLENREAFMLYEVEGLKLREISEMTGESLNTIAARVRRTREQLRDILESHLAAGERL